MTGVLRGARLGAGPGLRPPLTLRSRLLVTLAAVSAAVSLVVGASAVLGLREITLDRVDAQLVTALQRSSDARGGPARGPREPRATFRDGQVAGMERGDGVGGFLERPGQAEGTLAAEVPDTAGDGSDGAIVRAAVLDESGAAHAVPVDAAAALASVGEEDGPVTLHLDDLGEYRVVAEEVPDGDRLITGLPLADVQAMTYRLAALVALVTLLGLGLVLVAGSVLVGVALRPLDRVRATVARVSELPLDRGDVALAERVPDPDPRTEVGQVGSALNRMLEHVARALSARQASEMRVRQFVADASHELRTPLASIRGYAELVGRRRDPLPADVAHALSRVESEALRMSALVDDLLLLARLDEGRPLDQEVVDLSRLVADATGDATVGGRDHTWRSSLPDEEVPVLGDEHRLTQVVVNLLANARTHTPPGTQVRVSLQRDGEDAVLVVTDDGPGIPPDLADRAFERFARGDSSRSRGAGGTGLGLAIVDAVVRAHHGSADIRTAAGAGTSVEIRLPAVVLDGDPSRGTTGGRDLP